jgi:DNA-binding response OmpR family regulator
VPELGGGAMRPACPTCGQIVKDAPRIDEAIAALRLVGIQKQIVLALASARGRYLSLDELAQIVYLDDPEGGPETASRSIYVQINKLRKKFNHWGARIEGKGAHRNGYWRIISQFARGYALERAA